MHISRIRYSRKSFLLACTAGIAMLSSAVSSAQAETITAVMHAALRNLDPNVTTAYITRDHGYMVYDTLVAMDGNFQIQPQMADWNISEDGKTYTFTLRDGLTWHDGTPVTAEDCVASIKRWAQKDATGIKLTQYTESLTATDESTITLVLTEPVGFVLGALGKPSSYVPFMMPRRFAEMPISEPITEAVGSGPFKFVAAEFQPGVKAVYEKNPDYKPRSEEQSWAAGGKVVNVDRVEWVAMPDAQTAINALINDEIDYIDEPQADLLPLLDGNDNVKVENTNPFGLQVLGRFNFLTPPFNDVRYRRAAFLAMNQESFLAALSADPTLYEKCGAIFFCGTPLATDVGSETIVNGSGVEEAKKLLAELNYDGTPIRIIHPTDVNTQKTQPVVAKQLLEAVGFKVELISVDWQTALATRANQKPASEGGWNIFFTALGGADVSNPLTSPPLAATGQNAYPGWPSDEVIEQLRDEFARATDPAEQKRIAEELQRRAYEQVIYFPLGQLKTPAALSTKLSNVPVGPVAPYFWTVSKGE